MTQDSQTSNTDHSALRPAIGLSSSSDAPVAGEFGAHSSFPKSMQTADVCPAMDIQVDLVDPLVRLNSYARCKLNELRQKTSTYRKGFQSYIAFSRELLAGPRSIGAVCPSSPFLAQAMAGELGDIEKGLVLELGAGTGSITCALLQQGIAPERLIVIERSAALVEHLRQRFPAIRVIEGDARQLDTLLGGDVERVRAVVSGLPLRSLSRSVVTEIAQQIHRLLPEGGVFVQFTYDLSRPSVYPDMALRRARTQVIWKNLPPARVDTFVQQLDILAPPPGD